MYSTCLFCTRDLSHNEVLETLPIGRRIAFDAGQGRLWVVCPSCAKWNLVPFDTRLETIDACERFYRDTKTRYSTDNIGLARMRDGLDLVRIGAPQRPEFASWRYGAQYKRRRRQTLVLAGAGAVAGAAILLGLRFSGVIAGGVLSGMWRLPQHGWDAVRNRRRRVLVRLPDSNIAAMLKATHIESAHADLSDGYMRLRFLRPGTRHRREPDATVTVFGDEARLVTRRIMARLNDTVGSSAHLSDATRRLEMNAMETWIRKAAAKAVIGKPESRRWWKDHPSEERWKGYGGHAIRLGSLDPADRLAIEMWLSEEDEARALAGELKLLERQWRDAEALAKVADDLAVTDDVRKQLGNGG